MASFTQLTDATVGVSCHAWSPDGSQVAFAPNSNELKIVDAKSNASKFSLNEHDMVIAAIDWHPTSNFIVTCSHDRNAFVWNYDAAEDAWKPSLVILRIERALDVKWSPDGQKFAVASSAKCVPVCYYEQDNNWWVSKMIKKHKSTVLAVAWHPNSQIVATGSSDFKARVFSAHVANVDAEQTAGDFSGAGRRGRGFNTGGAPVVQTIRFPFLPLCQLLFLDEYKLVGAGHDMNPAVFANAGAWAFDAFVDKKGDEKKAAASSSSVARPTQIIPSVLPADFAALGIDCTKLEEAGCDRIQFDVMDGNFVPNLTFGPDVIAAQRKTTKLMFETQLMVSERCTDAMLPQFTECTKG
ncbi:hypothetical protein JL721_2750 [Aureococcus anophagefferens]|nr:hypothetical protein JL721_2750 [Aureococcus anophagefferens]